MAYFRLVLWLKIISILIILCSVCLILAHGRFENEFLRVSIIICSAVFTYYASFHYMIRHIVSLNNHINAF